MIISVIVVNYNGEKFIQHCLRAILASQYDDFELIVVDDGSTDRSPILANRLLEKSPRGKLIKLVENNGAPTARNRGARKARGELLFFLDADTQIATDCLVKLAAVFAADEKLGAAQAKLIDASSGKIETLGHFLSRVGFPYEITAEAQLSSSLIFGGRSAALAIRQKLFAEIGGFDEDYIIYAEDTDLCWRVWLSGKQIRYLPQADVVHYAKSSLDVKTNYRIFYEGAKNNTANILKNASFTTLVWILPLHIAGWIIVSIKLIMQGRFALAGWIYRGLLWNIKNLRKTLAKRKSPVDIKVMFGPAGHSQILFQGLRWLKTV